MNRRTDYIIIALAAALALAALGVLATTINSTPSCSERGGTPTTWKGNDACLLGGGVIGEK